MRLRKEQGQSTVIFALAAVAVMSMISLSLDVGRAYVEVQHLKSVADAAALAGGQDLPNNVSAASTDAISIAEAAGIPAQDIQVSVNPNDHVISVTTTGETKYYFAPIFGIDQGTFHETSVVQVGPINAVTGAMPFGVVWTNFVYGQTYQLKYGAGSGEDGNYGALALGGNGASVYRSNLENGYQQSLQVGEVVSTEPGNMKGPTDQGLSGRVQAGEGYTPQTVPISSQSLVYIPIISPPQEGKSQVTILGFAEFFLTGADCNGTVQGIFLRAATSGQFGTGTDYGLEAERLIQ